MKWRYEINQHFYKATFIYDMVYNGIPTNPVIFTMICIAINRWVKQA